MRNVCRLLLLLLVLAAVSYTSVAQTVPSQAPAAQQEKAFQGILVKVDSDAKTLTARGADNKDMVFHYTDKTEVIGSENVQGLAGKSGTKLNITYAVERGANTAMRIEMLRE
jgi:hypothetical protein